MSVRRVGSSLRISVTRSGSQRTPLVVAVRYAAGGRASATIPANKSSAQVPAPQKTLARPRTTTISVRAIGPTGRRGPARTFRLRGRGG